LAKAEEIDAFKDRVDQRFAEGRTSVLRLAIEDPYLRNTCSESRKAPPVDGSAAC
jgi:hypothetical protein